MSDKKIIMDKKTLEIFKKYGSIGGKIASKRITKEERIANGRKGALKRWGAKKKKD